MLNFIVRNRRKVASVHEQYLCRQVLFCSLHRLRIASLSAANFQPNNEDVSHRFLIGVGFVRDRALLFLKQYNVKIATDITTKQNIARDISYTIGFNKEKQIYKLYRSYTTFFLAFSAFFTSSAYRLLSGFILFLI